MATINLQQEQRKHIFISYNNADLKWAEWIAWQIEVERDTVSFAEWDTLTGSNSVLATNEALKKSDHVVVILSPEYLESIEHHPEWIAAFTQDRAGTQRKVLPIIVQECKQELAMAIGLDQLSMVDLINVDEVIARERLLTAIRGKRRKPTTAPTFPLTREQPLFPRSSQSSPLFVSPGEKTHQIISETPPLTDPRRIQPRKDIVQSIYAKLISPTTTALVLTGIGGVGKSTLAALVFNYAEEQRRLGLEPFVDEALWLNMDEIIPFTDMAEFIFHALSTPIPDFVHLKPRQQAEKLSLAMNMCERPRLIVLNQFEEFLEQSTGYVLPNRLGISEWLDLLNRRAHRCKVLLTSRLWPKRTHEEVSTYMEEHVDSGLTIIEGIELLRKQGIEERQATQEDLQVFVKHANGHALALTLLASILQHNPSLTLKDLVDNQMSIYTSLWEEGVAQKLLDYIYKQQLDHLQRRLLRIFSVYHEPVPLEAPQALINTVSPKQFLSAFQVLRTQHLLQDAGEKRYQLHPLIATYAHKHFNERSKQANTRALQAAHVETAQYYMRQPIFPISQRHHLSDVQPLLKAIWHYCEGQQLREAYLLMEQENIFVMLRHWGENTTVLELCEHLLVTGEEQFTSTQTANIYKNKGRAYADVGQDELARTAYEQALARFRVAGDKNGVGTTLNNLGRAYHTLGQHELALREHEEALSIFKELEDLGGQGTTLINKGACYQALGQYKEALGIYKRALELLKEVGYQPGQARALNDLGRIYVRLNEQEEALRCYEDALNIYQKMKDRRGEGWALHNLGLIYSALGQQEQAWHNLVKSLHVRKEVRNRWGEGAALQHLGYIAQAQGRYDLAIACFLLAQKIFEALNSPDRISVQHSLEKLLKKPGHEIFMTQLVEMEAKASQIVAQALNATEENDIFSQ